MRGWVGIKKNKQVEKIVTFKKHILHLIHGKDLASYLLGICIWNGAYVHICALVCVSMWMHLHTLNVDELTLPLIALCVELIPQISNLFSQSRIKIKLDRKLWDPEPTGTERVRQMTSKLWYKTYKCNNLPPWGQRERWLNERQVSYVDRWTEIWMESIKQSDIGKTKVKDRSKNWGWGVGGDTYTSHWEKGE